jgi:hypothetical protein
MKVFKKLTVMTLTLILIAGLFPVHSAQAATKPAKATFSAKANDDGTSVTLTIAKTKNAQDYKIMVKKPGAEKFTKLTALKKDGTAERTYTAKNLTAGEYSFKVRAYLKSGTKTVWGKYSKAVTVTVEDKTTKNDTGNEKDNNTGTVKENMTLNDYLGNYVNSDGGSMTFYYNENDNRYELWKIRYYANYVPYTDFEDNPMNWQNYMGVFGKNDVQKQSDGSYLIEYVQSYNCAAIGYTVILNKDGTGKITEINITNGKTKEAVFHK